VAQELQVLLPPFSAHSLREQELRTESAAYRASLLDLTEGRTLAYALSKINCLPRLIQEMLAAGEEAGALERLLSQGADYCERTARQLGVRIEAAAEPVMIVLIGAVIFFFVLSLMMPIFTAMDALM